MRAFLLALSLLALGGCSTISAVSTAANTPVREQTIADARNTVYATKSGYGVALPFMTAYVRQTPCSFPSAPPPPLCSNTEGVKTLAKARTTLSSVLNRAEALVLSASPTQSALSASIEAVKAAYAEFQIAMITYGIKQGG